MLMPAVEDPVCTATFSLDEELASAVAVARAEDTAREASASSEALDELTSEQILFARVPISMGIVLVRKKEGFVLDSFARERGGQNSGDVTTLTIGIIRGAVAAEYETGPDGRHELGGFRA